MHHAKVVIATKVSCSFGSSLVERGCLIPFPWSPTQLICYLSLVVALGNACRHLSIRDLYLSWNGPFRRHYGHHGRKGKEKRMGDETAGNRKRKLALNRNNKLASVLTQHTIYRSQQLAETDCLPFPKKMVVAATCDWRSYRRQSMEEFRQCQRRVVQCRCVLHI